MDAGGLLFGLPANIVRKGVAFPALPILEMLRGQVNGTGRRPLAGNGRVGYSSKKAGNQDGLYMHRLRL